MSSIGQIKVNGELIELSAPCELTKLLQQLDIMPSATVVELNGEIVLRENLAGTLLHAGDVLEIVRIVGGG